MYMCVYFYPPIAYNLRSLLGGQITRKLGERKRSEAKPKSFVPDGAAHKV